MIEALLKDKNQMQVKIEQLQSERKDTEQFLAKQKKICEERYEVELKKNKDAWQASEKLRR